MEHPVDPARLQLAVRDFLEALGHDPQQDPTFADTPRLVAEAWVNELLAGESVDLERLVREGSQPAGTNSELVAVRSIRVATVCPHHLLPAKGTAIAAYLPGKLLLGLGTLARLVEAASRRLTLQEDIAPRVTSTLMQAAGARGAYCRLELEHACLQVRHGGQQPDAVLVTTSAVGELATEPGAASLKLALLQPAGPTNG